MTPNDPIPPDQADPTNPTDASDLSDLNPTDPTDPTGEDTSALEPPTGWQHLRARWGAVAIAALLVWYAGTQVFFPGQVRITAPITCDADHPDLFVTKHKVERRATRRSPSFQHRAWCLSEDGDRVESSMLRAGLPLLPVYLLASAGAVVVWTNRVNRRSTSRAGVVDAGDRHSTSASGPIS